MIVMILLCSFLGIGYAAVSGITLDLDGTALLKKQDGIFITDVTLNGSNQANPSLSEIESFYQTILNSSIVLNDDALSSITYQITIRNSSNIDKIFKGIVYDTEFYDNPLITYELSNLSIDDVVEAGETVTFNLTFHYADALDNYTNTTLNSVLNFHFDNGINIVDEETYDGQCIFNGQGQNIVGDCAGGEQVDYIDTGIALFSNENYLKDFEIGFNIDNIDPSRFRSGQVDTIFACLYEDPPYPGITLRIQDSKWLLQVGTGLGTNTKIFFNQGDIQSFKLYKTNGDVYYQINGGEPVFVRNINLLSNNFNDHLTIGTSLDASGNPMSGRYLVAELSDFYVRLIEPEEQEVPEIDYSEVDQAIMDFLDEPMTTVFEEANTHLFDGTASSCFNTNVALFSEANYQKSFVVTFKLDNIDLKNQGSSNTQATVFNAKDESGNGYPGVMMRKQNTNYTLAIKDGGSVSSNVTIPATTKRVNIIKKGMKMYYQIDLGEIKALGNNNDLSSWSVSKCFNTGTTFGSIINGSGNYDRIVVGTMSNMKIQLGS